MKEVLGVEDLEYDEIPISANSVRWAQALAIYFFAWCT